jgi:hypothetical protein
MRRTQISLEEPLYEALRRRAFNRRVSMSQMVRDALAEYLAVPETTAVELGAPPAADQPPGETESK